MKRWLHWLLPVVVVALIGALIVGGRYLFTRPVAHPALQEALDELDRTDPGWRLEDLEKARPDVPDADNSALIVTRAHALRGARWPDPDFDEDFWDVPPTQRLTIAQRTRLSAEMDRVGPALEEARKLVDKPRGRHAFTINSNNPMKAPFPHVRKVHEVTQLLMYDSWKLSQKGELAKSAASCRAALNAARSLMDEPFFVSQLVRVSSVAVTCKMIERTLGQGELTEGDLASLQRVLEEEIGHPWLILSLRGERALTHAMFEALETGKVPLSEIEARLPLALFHGLLEPQPRDSLRSQHIQMFPLWASFLEAARLPDHERGPAMAALEARAVVQKHSFVGNLLPALRSMAKSFNSIQGRLRCLRVALAAERYRLQNEGRWPESIAVLTPQFLSEVPLDPFDGKPLRYLKRDGGIVVYSVGPDGEDNQGNLAAFGEEPGTDLGIQLWAPADRGHAPLCGPPEPK